jgi:tetratricopeptide (TPR) repeat protein
MISCIVVFYISVLGGPGLPPEGGGHTFLPPERGSHIHSSKDDRATLQDPGATPARDPDALYARRDDVESARQAAAIWAARLERHAQDFESAWKLARAQYWLGGHLPENERKAAYEQGIEAGRRAATVKPERPEGHFWQAANMGALAESFGLRQGIKYRKPVKQALETVLKIDPGFQDGSADRALGRWYDKVPGLFGGSNQKALEHLRRSLTYNPNSTASRFFLAEVLIDMNRRTEAREELQKVIDAPVNPDWAPEDREFKAKAAALLKKLPSRQQPILLVTHDS